jgi:hypothetical protein
MKLWIPKCGDALVLDEDWTFTLHGEYRNADVWKVIEDERSFQRAKRNFYQTEKDGMRPLKKTLDVTFPKGVELVVDRVYIRQQGDEFASVTFIVKDHPNFDFVGGRFWAKLDQVNEVVCTPTSTNNPVGGFAKRSYRKPKKTKKEIEKAEQKAEQAKVSQEAILNSVNAIAKACAGTAFTSHVDTVAQEAERLFNNAAANSWYVQNAMNNWWTSASGITVGSKQEHVQAMTSACRYKGQSSWKTSGSKKNADGTYTRRFSYVYHFGDVRVEVKEGFHVTTDGTKVINIKPV